MWFDQASKKRRGIDENDGIRLSDSEHWEYQQKRRRIEQADAIVNHDTDGIKNVTCVAAKTRQRGVSTAPSLYAFPC